MRPNLQHAIERVGRPGGSHEGVGRKKSFSTGSKQHGSGGCGSPPPPLQLVPLPVLLFLYKQGVASSVEGGEGPLMMTEGLLWASDSGINTGYSAYLYCIAA